MDFPQARKVGIPWIQEWLEIANRGVFHFFFQTVYYIFLFQRPLVTLEIGTGIGGSLGAMLLAGEVIRSQDPSFDYHVWTIDTLEGFGDKTTEVVSLLERKVPGRVIFEKRGAMDLEWVPPQPIDLLFLDNGHKQGDVLGPLSRYSQFIGPKGLIVVDDSWFEDVAGDSRGRTDIDQFLRENHSFYLIQARELPSADEYRGIAFLRRRPE